MIPDQDKIPINDPEFDPDDPTEPDWKKHPDEPPEDPFGLNPKPGPKVDPKPIDVD